MGVYVWWMHAHMYICECVYISIYIHVVISPPGKTDGNIYNEMCQKKKLYMVSAYTRTNKTCAIVYKKRNCLWFLISIQMN